MCRDATILFESHHLEHSQTAVVFALQNKLQLIGELESQHVEGGNPNFYLSLRRRVHERLTKLKMSSFYGTRYIAVEATFFIVFYLALSFLVGIYASFPLAILLGFANGRLGFIMHCGNHCSASRTPLVNTLAGLCLNLVGASSLIWRYQHQVAHHMYPNDPDRDQDCHSGKPYVRFHPKHKHFQWHCMNPLTTLAGMCVVLLKWFFEDFELFFRQRTAGTRMEIRPRDWVGLFVTKFQWVLLHVVFPAYFHDIRTVLALNGVFLATGAYYLSGTFIVNHIQEGLIADPRRHWAERQVLASSNWAAGSVFWNWASGGLNHQIEHHLFPSMSIYCYPYVHDIVVATCKEYDLPYRAYPSYSVALYNTLKYLYRLGVKAQFE